MVSADLDNVWDGEEWTGGIKITCNYWYVIMAYGKLLIHVECDGRLGKGKASQRK